MFLTPPLIHFHSKRPGTSGHVASTPSALPPPCSLSLPYNITRGSRLSPRGANLHNRKPHSKCINLQTHPFAHIVSLPDYLYIESCLVYQLLQYPTENFASFSSSQHWGHRPWSSPFTLSSRLCSTVASLTSKMDY